MNHLSNHPFKWSLAAAAIGILSITTSDLAHAQGNATTVTFFSWDNEDRMQPVIDAFEARHPQYKIDFSYGVGGREYISTLQIRLSSGTAADVFIIAGENRGTISTNRLALDLSEMEAVARTGISGQRLYGGPNGEIFGAAPGAWAGGVVYNKDLLSSVGYETVPEDWDGFLELCSALKASGIQPIVERGDEPSIILSANVGVINAELDAQMDRKIWAGETTFAETWTDAFAKLEQLVAQECMSRNVVGLNFSAAVSEFAGGRAAMFPIGTWALNSIRDAGPDLNLGMAAVPTSSRPFWAGAVSIGYAVNANARNPEGAKAFVEFLMSDESLRIYQQSTGQIVTVEGFVNDIPDLIRDAAVAATNGDIYWPSSWWVDNNQALLTHVVAVQQEVIMGNRTPEDAAASIDARLDTLR